MARVRRKGEKGEGEAGDEGAAARTAPTSVKLRVSLPEDGLLAGELELIQAHLAGLFDRVFPPQEKSVPLPDGDDAPWP